MSILQDEIESFMKLAELLKVKGLVEEEERERSQAVPPPQRMPKMPPGINVRRRTTAAAASPATAAGASPVPPAKRAKIDGGRKGTAAGAAAAVSVPTPQPEEPKPPRQPEFGDDEDIHELPPSGDFMQPAFDGGQGGFDQGDVAGYGLIPPEDPTAPTPGPSSGAAGPSPSKSTRLIALQCPQCPTRLPGVEAFREHMSSAHQKGGTDQKPSGSGAKVSGAASRTQADVAVACEICDKTFKNHKCMLGHQRRIHKITQQHHQVQLDPTSGQLAPAADGSSPAGMDPEQKKRGRPRKKAVGPPPPLEQIMQPHPDDGSGVFEAQQQKPIGQVQPAPRGSQQQMKAAEMETPPPQPRPLPVVPPTGSRPQPLGPGSSPSTSAGAPRGPQRLQRPFPGAGRGRPLPQGSAPDIKRLGMKYGGQISITSSDSNPSPSSSASVVSSAAPPPPRKEGGEGPSGMGISITKMKGDVPVGNPHGMNPRPGPSSSRGSAASAVPDVMVKQEPEEEEGYLEDEDEMAHEYGDEGDYDDAAEVSGSGDGMYAYGGEEVGEEEDIEDIDEEGEYQGEGEEEEDIIEGMEYQVHDDEKA